MSYTIHAGNNLDILPTLPDNSVDSIVTDPPYELGFMGKKWDNSGIAYSVELWTECLRVLKPGGHLLSFGGTRTWHRVAVAIEDAGFELRDSIAWMYGSGFPKSLNVAKSIEAKLTTGSAAKNGFHSLDGERTGDGKIGMYATVAEQGFRKHNPEQLGSFDLEASTPEAQKWQGWGTALKPAFEPIVVARKPLIGTVAANVLEHGTGALNIDGSRIGTEENLARAQYESKGWKNTSGMTGSTNDDWKKGRWPANVILDEYSAGELDEQSGVSQSPAPYTQQSKSIGIYGAEKQHDRPSTHHGDTGGASRFFYCAKASKRDRNEGLEGLEAVSASKGHGREPESAGAKNPRAGIGGGSATATGNASRQNFHPTVKPTNLMRYLVKLVTPPGGTVLDPFTGSGSTGKAAILEGFDFIGIEITEEYLPIIEGRLAYAEQMRLNEQQKKDEGLF